MKVLVLAGGDSNEREVSFRSASSVIESLERLGHQVVEYDPAQGLAGLDKFKNTVDVVLPILHGKNGEDGVIQSKLEQLKLRYLGADSGVSRLCFNKNLFKKKITKMNISTPKWKVVDQDSFIKSALINKPFVLKPIGGGSTIDALIVRGEHKNKTQAYKLLDKYKSMLLEELIVGSEITVPVLGHDALPVIEIIPPANAEFDYENKYNGKIQELCPPLNIPKAIQNKAQHFAEQVHNSLGVRHLSRSDFMISAEEQLYMLELNTIPGLTDQSLFPKSAKVAGISMDNLVKKFIKLASGS